MTVKTGSAWAGLFVTLDATGAKAASSDAAGVLYVDGVANGATVTISGSNPYKWAVTLPSLTAGQRFDMYITATIATIATAGIVASEQADTAILSDGVVVNSGTVTTLTNLPAVTTDWLTADGVKADAVTKIQNGLATPTNITAGTIATVTNAVKVSAGTGAGQLDFTSGVVKVNLVQILGQAISGTASLIVAAFSKFFNIASPTGTVNSLPDAVPGTSSGVALQDTLTNLGTRLSAARAGYLDKLNVTGALAHSDAAATYKADVSGLATQTSVNAIPTAPLLAANYVAPDNASVGAIKTKTDQLVFTTPNKVDASATIDPTGLATSAALATVDGIVDDIKAKTDQLVFTTPNRVDASATVDPTGIATSAELEAVDDKVDAIKAKTDALDVSSVSFVTSVVGSTITILRGDTWDDGHLLALGDLSQYVSIDFTVKRHSYDTDDEAIIRIRKNASGLNDGLVRLNGAAHTVGADGYITIDDLVAGNITPILKANVTDDLEPGTYYYDAQLITAAEITTKTSGTYLVTPDITRLVA